MNRNFMSDIESYKYLIKPVFTYDINNEILYESNVIQKFINFDFST